MAEAPSLSSPFLAGTNPVPFAVALVVMGGVMLAFPKAAVPLAVVLVLGALMVDNHALAEFQAWQEGKRK